MAVWRWIWRLAKFSIWNFGFLLKISINNNLFWVQLCLTSATWTVWMMGRAGRGTASLSLRMRSPSSWRRSRRNKILNFWTFGEIYPLLVVTFTEQLNSLKVTLSLMWYVLSRYLTPLGLAQMSCSGRDCGERVSNVFNGTEILFVGWAHCFYRL